MFGPHGLGSQGSSSTTGSIAVRELSKLGKSIYLIMLTYWAQSAGRKGISFITLDASAGGDVVDHSAISIDATQARARVHTVQS